MREVKYRLWCKIKGLEKMYYLTGFDIKNSKYDDGRDCVIIHILFGERSKTLFSTDQVELMQYTGLKDKNNIDIYEGDILCWPEYEGTKNQTRWDVEWNNARAGWSDWSPRNKAEIIGNIYEHPQLLETKPQTANQ